MCLGPYTKLYIRMHRCMRGAHMYSAVECKMSTLALKANACPRIYPYLPTSIAIPNMSCAWAPPPCSRRSCARGRSATSFWRSGCWRYWAPRPSQVFAPEDRTKLKRSNESVGCECIWWSRKFDAHRKNEVGFFEGVSAKRFGLVAGVELDFLVREDGDMDAVRHTHPVGKARPCFEDMDTECSSSGTEKRTRGRCRDE